MSHIADERTAFSEDISSIKFHLPERSQLYRMKN